MSDEDRASRESFDATAYAEVLEFIANWARRRTEATLDPNGTMLRNTIVLLRESHAWLSANRPPLWTSGADRLLEVVDSALPVDVDLVIWTLQDTAIELRVVKRLVYLRLLGRIASRSK